MVRHDRPLQQRTSLRSPALIALRRGGHVPAVWSSPVAPGWPRRSLAVALAGLSLMLAALPARAQRPSPNQPMAIEGLPPEPCPLLLPGGDRALQPLRIQPSQVARKNAVGCLSPADAAVYGPDGCPVKLCRAPQGTVPLPQF